MPASSCPDHLQHHINLLRRELECVEAQISALKTKNEPQTKKFGKENRKVLTKQGPLQQNTQKLGETKQTKLHAEQKLRVKPQEAKQTREKMKCNPTEKTQENVLLDGNHGISGKRVPKLGQKGAKVERGKPGTGRSEVGEKEKCRERTDEYEDVDKCLCCQQGRKSMFKQVTTTICRRCYDVHHTIRIPVSDMPVKTIETVSSTTGDRTWRDILQSNRRDEVSKTTQQPKQTTPQSHPRNPVMPENDPSAAKEMLQMLQKEVREAREGKAQAQKDVIKANLALGKMQALAEANAALVLSHQRAVSLVEKRIEERMAMERRRFTEDALHTALTLTESCQPSTISTRSRSTLSSSLRFRASSPAKSEKSSTTSESSWHELSSINSVTFNTI